MYIYIYNIYIYIYIYKKIARKKWPDAFTTISVERTHKVLLNKGHFESLPPNVGIPLNKRKDC